MRVSLNFDSMLSPNPFLSSAPVISRVRLRIRNPLAKPGHDPLRSGRAAGRTSTLAQVRGPSGTIQTAGT